MSLRTERVGSLIKEEVGMLFEREFNTSEFGFMTITEVIMTPDLKTAKIYVSIFGSAEVKERTMIHLEEKKSHVKHLIGSTVRLKFVPSVHFYLDDTMERVTRLENIFKEIHQHEMQATEK